MNPFSLFSNYALQGSSQSNPLKMPHPVHLYEISEFTNFYYKSWGKITAGCVLETINIILRLCIIYQFERLKQHCNVTNMEE